MNKQNLAASMQFPLLTVAAGIAVTLAAVFSASATAQPQSTVAVEPLPASPAEWALAARRDIEAAYQLLADNHPAMVDPDNPGFPRQLAAARRAGLALARQVTTPMGYDAAIAAFGNALQDGHAGAFATIPQALRPARQWPGFVPAWRGSRMFVHFSSETDAPRGAEIVACDGTPIRTLAMRNVFRFRGRAGEAGNWWTQARNVLVDTGNPFITRPVRCQLRQNGRSRTIQLNWRAEEGQQFSQWRTASYNGATLPIGMTTPAPGITWIAMPDFDPNADGIAAYQAMNTAIVAQRAVILSGRAIVLDLRDNQGGSSGWSRDVANALWGAAAANAQMARYFARSSVVWRASAGNEAHVRATVPSLRNAGFVDVASEWTVLADQMAAARAAGRSTVTEAMAGAGLSLPPMVQSDLSVPVYVIVPGQCASACLDAVDVFTRFPNTRLIGAPSSGDSRYMEVRQQALPSGLASVTIPNKMWVNRPRGHSVGYAAAIEVMTLDWSTEEFLGIVETDLIARR